MWIGVRKWSRERASVPMNFVILTPPKPRFTEPCNGCGACCNAATCDVGVQFLNAPQQAPCPALEWDGTKYRCGLITNPAHHMGLPRFGHKHDTELSEYLGKGFAILIASGQGCGMDDAPDLISV